MISSSPECSIRREIPHWSRKDERAPRTRKLGPDGELDFAAAGLHALEGLRQVRQTNFLGDKVVRGNVATANGLEGLAEEPRRVVKGGNELDFGIVDGGRLDFEMRAGGQATEEIHRTAAAHQRKRH